jgi:hypothetical protein
VKFGLYRAQCVRWPEVNNLGRSLRQFATDWLQSSDQLPFLDGRYSYRSATIGSTRAALLAGIQHASTPVASNNTTVHAKVTGS